MFIKWLLWKRPSRSVRCTDWKMSIKIFVVEICNRKINCRSETKTKNDKNYIIWWLFKKLYLQCYKNICVCHPLLKNSKDRWFLCWLQRSQKSQNVTLRRVFYSYFGQKLYSHYLLYMCDLILYELWIQHIFLLFCVLRHTVKYSFWNIFTIYKNLILYYQVQIRKARTIHHILIVSSSLFYLLSSYYIYIHTTLILDILSLENSFKAIGTYETMKTTSSFFHIYLYMKLYNCNPIL